VKGLCERGNEGVVIGREGWRLREMEIEGEGVVIGGEGWRLREMEIEGEGVVIGRECDGD
jgi:hypothetical protein